MQTEKLSMDIGFANLVAVRFEDPHFREISVQLECKDTGLVLQDIALVRSAVDVDNGHAPIPNAVDCLVWSDNLNEDYTHKFVIGLCADEGEGQ